MHDCRLKISETPELAFRFRLIVRQIQIQHHEHAGFSIHAHQCDQPDPHADTHVVAEEVKKPDGAHGRERYGQDDNHGLRHGLRVEIQQHDDQKNRERQHHDQLVPNTLHGLVLAAPGERIPGWKLDLIAYHLLRFLDIAADIAAGNVDVYV